MIKRIFWLGLLVGLLGLTAVACNTPSPAPETLESENPETDVESVPVDGATAEGVDILVRPDELLVGSTQIMVGVQTLNEEPINDAIVSVSGVVQGVEGYRARFGSSDFARDGIYAVPFLFADSGEWLLTVEVQLADGTEIIEEAGPFTVE